MHSAKNFASTMSEPLTWREIREQYPDQWVCLVEFDRVDLRKFAFRTARVVGHSKCRHDAVEQARPWWRQYEELGQHFTGQTDDHVLPRSFVRIDLPWNPVPRFHPCCDVEPEVSPATNWRR
jgi:hypothetical protein